MKQYELMTIVDMSLGEEGARNISNSIKDLITSLKGKVLNSDMMGKRKFAYELNGEKEGYYEVIDYEMDPGNAPKMNEKLNLTEGLARYLIVTKE